MSSPLDLPPPGGAQGFGPRAEILPEIMPEILPEVLPEVLPEILPEMLSTTEGVQADDWVEACIAGNERFEPDALQAELHRLTRTLTLSLTRTPTPTLPQPQNPNPNPHPSSGGAAGGVDHAGERRRRARGRVHGGLPAGADQPRSWCLTHTHSVK